MAAMREYEPHAVAADWPTLRDAASFRIEMRAKGLDCSFVDAIGFVLARREPLPFLTGDKAFQKLPGAEFLPASM